jgi:hypothetical protein
MFRGHIYGWPCFVVGLLWLKIAGQKAAGVCGFGSGIHYGRTLVIFSQASGRHQNIRLETRRILQDVSRAASRDMPHFLPP